MFCEFPTPVEISSKLHRASVSLVDVPIPRRKGKAYNKLWARRKPPTMAGFSFLNHAFRENNPRDVLRVDATTKIPVSYFHKKLYVTKPLGLKSDLVTTWALRDMDPARRKIRF